MSIRGFPRPSDPAAQPVLRRVLRRIRGVGLALLVVVGCGLAGRPATAAEFTSEQRQAIETIIHDYLTKNPDLMLDVLQAAEDKLRGDAREKASTALVEHRREIFDDPETPVGGNPKGDVSLVEFFDYRCPYCKQVEPHLEALLAQDAKLRFVYKEFPVLGPDSTTAARAALAAGQQGKYEAVHRALMKLKGPINEIAVLQAVGAAGVDVERLKRDMQMPVIDRMLKANMALAEALDIHGTPGFVIGDQIVPGAIGLDDLKELIGAARRKAPG